MIQLDIPSSAVSDGYHTFPELYEHRHMLLAAVVKLMPEQCWCARKHADGSACEGWFVVGIDLAEGQVTYHLPEYWWERITALLSPRAIYLYAPPYDGHTPTDVLYRLAAWIGIEDYR